MPIKSPIHLIMQLIIVDSLIIHFQSIYTMNAN